MVLEELVRYVERVAAVNAFEDHAGQPVIQIVSIDRLNRTRASDTLSKDCSVDEMWLRNKRLLSQALAVPFSLSLAACAADNHSTGAEVRLNGKECANTAHELSLDFEIGSNFFRRSTRTVVQRHEFTLDIAQAGVYKLLAEKNRSFCLI